MNGPRRDWTYWVGLGANLGEPVLQLERALESLTAGGLTLEARSGWWRTAPVGGPAGQPDFANGVARFRGRSTPLECLRLLQQVEWAAGRRREGAPRWGPRLLDLDLLDALPPDGRRERREGAWGWVLAASRRPAGGIQGGPRLELPHPRLRQRGFVLGPWAEIDPQHALPDGTTVGALWKHLEVQGRP